MTVMKTLHRVFIAILSIVLITAVSCSKSSGKDDNGNAVHAIFTGYDMRMCACCGGLMVNFEGKTEPAFSPEYYQVKNTPESIGIASTATFPVHADVTYVVEAEPGCGTKGFVTITSIKIRK
jgi:hypothetical protein